MSPFTTGSKKTNLSNSGPVQKLFTRESHNFKYHRHPTITVTATDCGSSGVVGNLDALASTAPTSPAPFFPTLNWHFATPDDNNDALPSSEKESSSSDFITSKLSRVVEYLIVIEDLDGSNRFIPLTTPPLLGIFYGLPATRTEVKPGTDLIKLKKGMLERITVAQRDLSGGFKYGDVDGKVWKIPRKGHRLHFQVVALSRSVDTGALSEHPTKESFRGAVEGFVLGWGEWVGILSG